MSVFVCVCVRVYVCVRVGVRMCLCVCVWVSECVVTHRGAVMGELSDGSEQASRKPLPKQSPHADLNCEHRIQSPEC